MRPARHRVDVGRSVEQLTSPLWRVPGLRSLAYLCVLGFAGFFLTLSSLPLYAISIGASTGAAGLVTTAMLGCTVAGQSLVPVAVGRYGLVPVLAAGLVLLGAPALLYPIGRRFWVLLAVSAVRGLGFAVLTVLSPLVASRLVGVQRRGEAIGLYGLAIAVPNLVAVPAGVALTAAGDFALVAVLAAAPLLALPLLPSLSRAMLPALDAPPGTAAPDARRTVRVTAGPVVVLLVVTLSGGGVLTFLPVDRPEGALATVALLVFGGCGALARWRAGVLSDRWSPGLVLPMAVLVTAVGMGMIAAGLTLTGSGAGTQVVVLLGAAVLGVGYGAVQNVTILVAFERAGPANQTTASAVWNAAYDSGTAIGAFAVGAVAGGGGNPAAGPGFPATFAGCGVLVLLSLPAALAVTRKRAG